MHASLCLPSSWYHSILVRALPGRPAAVTEIRGNSQEYRSASPRCLSRCLSHVIMSALQVRKARQDASRPTAEAEQVPEKHKREWALPPAAIRSRQTLPPDAKDCEWTRCTTC